MIDALGGPTTCGPGVRCRAAEIHALEAWPNGTSRAKRGLCEKWSVCYP